MISFTVSARQKKSGQTIEELLDRYRLLVRDAEITSVYGFSTHSPLYGGRNFDEPQLSDEDLEYLFENNIGFRIPLSSSFFNENDYERTKPLLDKHHNKLNSIICTNDELALRIREDYPEYTIEASAIKNIKAKNVNKYLDMYDSVVLPMVANDDLVGLSKIKNKDRVILFANGGCAYRCSSKICYSQVSKMNNGTYIEGTPACSIGLKPRRVDGEGLHFFNVEELIQLGFTRFKLLSI
jgi:hypothetical protein